VLRAEVFILECGALALLVIFVARMVWREYSNLRDDIRAERKNHRG
jgi:hypothetical protein